MEKIRAENLTMWEIELLEIEFKEKQYLKIKKCQKCNENHLIPWNRYICRECYFNEYFYEEKEVREFMNKLKESK